MKKRKIRKAKFVEMKNRDGVILRIPSHFRIADLLAMGATHIGFVAKDSPPPKTDNEYRSVK